MIMDSQSDSSEISRDFTDSSGPQKKVKSDNPSDPPETSPMFRRRHLSFLQQSVHIGDTVVLQP